MKCGRYLLIWNRIVIAIIQKSGIICDFFNIFIYRHNTIVHIFDNIIIKLNTGSFHIILLHMKHTCKHDTIYIILYSNTCMYFF